MSVPFEAADLGKRYRRRWALRHCSIRLPAGRIAALVGPNGAGKTTLLHLALGLLHPTEGNVNLFGWSPIRDPDLVLAHVGFVAQDTPLYDSFSVADMLQLGRRLNRRWEQAAAEARLRQLGIRLGHRVGQLSGGHRAQVALVLALAKKPDLLLLDEPFARLDPLARMEFLQALMDAAAEESVTMVLSSHLVGELERTCDYLMLLSGGRLQLSGDIGKLVAAHRLLVGPRREEGPWLPELEVVRSSHSERQTMIWARGEVRGLPAGWRAEPLALEHVILAYMASPEAKPWVDQALEATVG
jgi:ABC-2 type transport system ATP-binding protein